MRGPMLYREKPNVVIPRKFIADDKAYGEALEAFVAVCTDCLFFNQEKGTVYLAKRKAKPMSCEWWFIGGRVFAGEDEHTAMRRCIKRETGLEIDPERIDFLAMKRYLFKDRQQEPQEKGCDSLCYIFGLEVTEAEIATVRSNLDKNEYDLEAGLLEFDSAKLTAENVFPSIIDVYEKVFPHIAVERPARDEVEVWDILGLDDGGYKMLNYADVSVQGKDLPMRKLREKIPKDKMAEFRKLLDKEGHMGLKDIKPWSKASILLGKVLRIFCGDYLAEPIRYYYTVYPDGTVTEGGWTQMAYEPEDVYPDKPRRQVHRWKKDHYVDPRIGDKKREARLKAEFEEIHRARENSVNVSFERLPLSADEFFDLTRQLRKLFKGFRSQDAYMGAGQPVGGPPLPPYCGFYVPKDVYPDVMRFLGEVKCGLKQKCILQWVKKQ